MIQRVLAMVIAAAVVLIASNLQQAKAEKKKESYAACKAKVSKEPPCSTIWSKACAAQCGSKF